MAAKDIRIPKQKITDLCRRHHIKKLSLFGSILTPNFNKNSDIDILVEFETIKTPGLMGITSIEEELQNLLGRNIDLRTPKELSRYFRDEVLSKAKVAYAH